MKVAWAYAFFIPKIWRIRRDMNYLKLVIYLAAYSSAFAAAFTIGWALGSSI